MHFKSVRRLFGIASLIYLLNPNSIYRGNKTTLDEKLNFPSSQEIMGFYTDCDNRTYFEGRFDLEKTKDEVSQGVLERRELENFLILYFKSKTKRIPENDAEEIYHPLGGKGRFENSFNYPRIRFGKWKEKHNAIDIFARIGSEIFSPIDGVVVASSENWIGRWDKKKGFVYESGGLSSLSGNGIILFNPRDKGYYLMIHMKDVYAKTGDIVFRGEIVGTVGKTGNSISPSSKPHLHLALKKRGVGCGIEGVLVAKNPYTILRKARNVLTSSN